MTKGEGAVAKATVASPEDMLRDLVTGRRADVPAGGIPGVAIVYQSGPARIHESWTKGPVVITPEREVLVDCELEAGGIVIERVRFGFGPRTWRFPTPSNPPQKRKDSPPKSPRILKPLDVPQTTDSHSSGRQTLAETE